MTPCRFVRAPEGLLPMSLPPVRADNAGKGHAGKKEETPAAKLRTCRKQRKGDQPDPGRHQDSRHLQTMTTRPLTIILLK